MELQTSECKWTFIDGLLLMDLNAAFDTVDHNVLLDLLQKMFGLRETVLKWFTDYLSNRSFKVCVEVEYSVCIDLKFSVPQGSLLGPLVFNSYSSAVIDIILTDLNVHSFADDQSLQKSFKPGMKEETELMMKLESSLENIQLWMRHNTLNLNPNKTEFILFGSRAQLLKCFTNKINVSGSKVECSLIVQYLGAWLDQSLDFKHHSSIKCRTASWILKRLDLYNIC